MEAIKVRVWDKEQNKFLEIGMDKGQVTPDYSSECGLFFALNGYVDENGYAYEVDAEILQYTGIADKNGKGICEGDIVEAWSNGSRGTFEIRWRQGGAPCFMLYPAFQNGERWRLHGTQDKHGNYYDDVEVIGNIYENPELLKNSTK